MDQAILYDGLLSMSAHDQILQKKTTVETMTLYCKICIHAGM